MTHKALNLVPAPWHPPITTQTQLKGFIRTNKDFHTADIIHGYGVACTPRELKGQGYTHAQIRYGKKLEKVWYGQL